MVHRGVASLALALATCFLVLSHFDPQFFLVHFYESLIYLAIVLMLFYFEDRWAYMLGITRAGGLASLVHADRRPYGDSAASCTCPQVAAAGLCGAFFGGNHADFGGAADDFLCVPMAP